MFGRNRKTSTIPTTVTAEVPTEDELALVALVARNYAGGQLPAWGAPCRCTECAEYGMPIVVEPRTAVFSCTSCKHEWTLSRAAVKAHQASLAPAEIVIEVPEYDPTPGALHRMALEGGIDRAASAIADAIASALRPTDAESALAAA